MPLIAFVGDCHYQIASMYTYLLNWQSRTGIHIDAIVHVGDFGVDSYGKDWMAIWSRRSVPIPTWVCMGNHENIDSIMEWQLQPYRIKDLHLLPDGGVTNVLGVTIGSVWGNYSPKSWLHPERVDEQRYKRVKHSLKAMHILKPSVDNLLGYGGEMDVLITHDCAAICPPKGFSDKVVSPVIAGLLGLDPDEKCPPGCPGFNQILDKYKPKYYFYGHFHVLDSRELEGTKVVCLNAFDFNPQEAIELVRF